MSINTVKVNAADKPETYPVIKKFIGNGNADTVVLFRDRNSGVVLHDSLSPERVGKVEGAFRDAGDGSVWANAEITLSSL